MRFDGDSITGQGEIWLRDPDGYTVVLERKALHNELAPLARAMGRVVITAHPL